MTTVHQQLLELIREKWAEHVPTMAWHTEPDLRLNVHGDMIGWSQVDKPKGDDIWLMSTELFYKPMIELAAWKVARWHAMTNELDICVSGVGDDIGVNIGTVDADGKRTLLGGGMTDADALLAALKTIAGVKG